VAELYQQHKFSEIEEAEATLHVISLDDDDKNYSIEVAVFMNNIFSCQCDAPCNCLLLDIKTKKPDPTEEILFFLIGLHR